MKVPFVDANGKKICDIEMTSQPAQDISFEYSGKYYKVTAVAGDAAEGYKCTVREIREDQV